MSDKINEIPNCECGSPQRLETAGGTGAWYECTTPENHRTSRGYEIEKPDKDGEVEVCNHFSNDDHTLWLKKEDLQLMLRFFEREECVACKEHEETMRQLGVELNGLKIVNQMSTDALISAREGVEEMVDGIKKVKEYVQKLFKFTEEEWKMILEDKKETS